MARMGRDKIEDLARRALEGAGTVPRAAASLSRARLVRALLDGLKALFNTAGPVLVYPSSGTGASEAALSNTL